MYQLKDLQDRDAPMACIDGKWVPARPINYQCRTLLERLKEAWLVFQGKADAFIWPGGQ